MKINRLKIGLFTIVNVLMIFAVFVIIILFSLENNKRFDLTENRRFTLDDKSIRFASSLDKDVEIIVFYGRGSRFKDSAADLLKMYQPYTKKFVIDYKETNANPLLAKEYNLTQVDTIVLKTDQRRELLTSLSEENFTNALIKVSQEGERKIGLVEGHGERTISEQDQGSFYVAAEDLKKENFVIESINLLGQEDIPDDFDMLLIAGPQSTFTEGELDKIRKFIAKGGGLMVMLNPAHQNEELAAFLNKEFGVIVREEVVIDQLGENFFSNPFVAMIPMGHYGDHPITKDFNLNSNFFFSRPVQLSETPPDGTVFSFLAKTSPAPLSWAKKLTVDSTESDLRYNENTDLAGPIILAVAGTAPAPEKTVSLENPGAPQNSRVVIFGNVDFASNEFYNMQGNKNIFLNSISWLTEQEDLISIREPELMYSPLNLDNEQKTKLWTISILMMPGIVLLAGVFMLISRR